MYPPIDAQPDDQLVILVYVHTLDSADFERSLLASHRETLDLFAVAASGCQKTSGTYRDSLIFYVFQFPTREAAEWFATNVREPWFVGDTSMSIRAHWRQDEEIA